MAQARLLHELRDSRDVRVFTLIERLNHSRLFALGAILAELELALQPLDLDVKTHNMFHHPALILFAQPGPLRHVGRFESVDHAMQGCSQAFFVREQSGLAVNMYRRVVPGGNALSVLIEAG